MEITSEKATVEVSDGTSMDLFTSRPQGGGRRPGLLVLQEAFGVNAHIRDVAGRFARGGWVAAAPELFPRTAPGFDGDYAVFASAAPPLRAMTDAGLTADLNA